MLRIGLLLPLSLGLVIAGCGGSGTEDVPPEDFGDISLPDPSVEEETGYGTIGPVSYSFDDSRLTRAEVELPIPPDYKTRVWAIKLIPTERADMLGKIACRYGDSTKDQECNVADEAGLALAMLERPITDYRDSFAQNGFGEEQLGSTEIAGQVGFAYNTEENGRPTEYRFVPVSGRTLMLMRQAGPGLGRASKAITAVVSGLRVSKLSH
ncbi:hypothetical protein FHS61_002446 [Altererythrobacter atlanticus]|uniref:Uncharacterized protein n=1 Tax=Croceibacterium atlanticum TaxID=1267766 RepID=A0A0F7KSB9_9SPHN|nr:hypothetical protein [Croceibacterium atlanticum]AKH42021.1 hypothetical protein WYH_00973 [Croceibacterium atlanticum]MBB5733411.1 hypothetical protein [Croceibacterium atlanticum]